MMSSSLKHKGPLAKPSDQRFLWAGIASALMFCMGERLDSYIVCLIFKPIPVFCMIAWVLWNAKTTSLFRRLIVVGLIFGALGDILLSLRYEDAFMHGLLAFLVGHIFYVIAFRAVSTERRLHYQVFHWIPYLMVGTGILMYLKFGADLGGMYIPICVYTTMLTVCCWQASLAAVDRIGYKDVPSYYSFFQRWAPVIGAGLFTFSDMMIAFQRFIPHFYSSSTTRMVYMIIYYIGQWAIAYSTVERKGSAQYWKSEVALKELDARRQEKLKKLQ